MSCTPVLSRQAKTLSKACDPDWQKDTPVDEFRTAGPEAMVSPTSPLSERDDVTDAENTFANYNDPSKEVNDRCLAKSLP